MTPPCANCHREASETTPGLEWPTLPPAVTPQQAPCPAMDRWPEWLRQPQPGLQGQPWWVRHNFEAARRGGLPLRIDVAQAELQGTIRLRSNTQQMLPWPWASSPYHVLAISTRDQAQLSLAISVHDNAVPLQMRDLITFQGIHLDGPANFNFWPETLHVGDFGQLHAISSTNRGVLFLIDPFMVPRPPIGCDMPTERQYEALSDNRDHMPVFDGGLDNCPQFLLYPNHRDDPRIDMILNDFLPAEFLDADGRLPNRFGLEEILDRLLRWRQTHPSPATTNPRGVISRLRDTVRQFEAFLVPGSSLHLQVEELRDLFLPGLLDLSGAHGTLEVTHLGHGRFQAELSDLLVVSDPIDYPAVPGPERPPLRLESASLSSGSSPTELHGSTLAPGLLATFDLNTGELRLRGNLELQLDLTLPGLGAVEFSARLSLDSTLGVDDAGTYLVPGTTSLQLENLELWRAGAETPLWSQGRLEISDDPSTTDSEGWRYWSDIGVPGFRFTASGWTGRASFFDLSGTLPVPSRPDGRYDFSRLLSELAIQVALQVNGPQRYAGELSVQAVVEENAEPNSSRRHYRADFSLRQASDVGPWRPWVEGGQMDLILEHPEPGHDQVQLRLSAEQFQSSQVSLREPEVQFSVDRLQYQEGVTQLRIPEFELSANSQNSGRGLIRGPLRIALRPTPAGGFELTWDGPQHRLDFRNLDLLFNAQGLRVLPERLRAAFDPRVVAVGLGGHLEGHFEMLFPEDRRSWHGRGDLRLSGSPRGDVYLLDAAGHRIGRPLIRDTRWRFRRIDRIDWHRRYALGDFYLDTLLNFSALLPADRRHDSSDAAPVYGQLGQRLLPYEIDGIMPYNNQPWDARGFQNRIVDYLQALCRRDPHCREEMP